jgi:broad specificity phosphatase PhoE
MELWLVRHGESTWNTVGRFQGGQDPPLSPRGRVQAAALAAGLEGHRFEALYTSPLGRARETAALCGVALGLEPVVLGELRELGLGDWEGLTLDAVRALAGEGYRRWVDAPLDHPAPGGESVAALSARVHGALGALTARHAGDRVLAVSHGGAIATVLCQALGLSLNALWRFRLDNASITRVALSPPRVLAVNETEHLLGLRVPAPEPAAAPADGAAR